MLEWEEQGLFPIDIGDEKYNRGSAGSATEMVMNILKLVPSVAEKKLIEILRRNNKTGYLKSFHFSVSWLIRELYELDGYDQTEIIERAGRVVHAFLAVEDMAEAATEVDSATDTEPLRVMRDITKNCNDAPFTVGRFLRDLERLGHPVDEIRKECEWWFGGFSDVKTVLEKAQDEYAAMPKTRFPAGNFRATFVTTNNYFVSKVAARDPETDILLVRRSTGHTAFLPRELDISDLAREIKALEPDDRWYHHQGPGQLINGGKVYGGAEYEAAKPTALSNEKLTELLQRFPPQKRMVARQPSQSSRRFYRR
ncbi:MAG: hypothetical protein A2746_00715 [Candidatus Yanofskybacteria bacterium RIFCSPHIGHO2_01_FULL_44_22]|uniref:Uncharacterized protein n=1 Tax=Candidatus Yanofskybacteria bacterium RIFCSPHIGHO2_01_FULL_44_22 TaxID=1802669 RepID=A0A1F8EYA5_9BACT|nr:MAG: hypothetical protein A2746_00715 [Candidatus Yanofskybacteria bacterium RIFCSPHIGHO2_01_FULL_44_22]